MSDLSDDTLDLGAGFARKLFAPVSPEFRIEFGAASHQGHFRPNNEDHYVVVKRRRTNEVLLTNLATNDLVMTDDSAYAMVVADGVGGARFGEYASRLVLQRMFELVRQATSWVMKYTDIDAQQIPERVEAYLHELQATFQDSMLADPKLAGMGTTWTSAHVFPPHAVIVHLGDSRAYAFTDGLLVQLTRDDTVAQEYLEMGMHPQRAKRFRSILLNSLGGPCDAVSAQIYHVEFQEQTQLLLCTDGLTNMVEDRDIAAILRQDLSPQAACDRLVTAALDAGGKDNVTVVIATLKPETSP